jgi:ubiquinone/menaquinone biosynthesis C-methylase UbiE
MPSTKDRIRRAFARAAGTYDLYASSQARLAEEMDRLLAAWHPEPFESVLEFGCGTGLFSSRLCARLPGASFVFTDIAKPMADACAKKITSRFPGVSARFETRDAGARLARTEKGRFGLVTSSAALQWIPDPSAALTRWASGLRPGGALFYSTASSRTFAELERVINLWLENTGRKPAHLPAWRFPAEAVPPGFDLSGWRNVRTAEFSVRQEHASLLEMLKSVQKTGEYGDGLPGGTLSSPGTMRELDALFRNEYGAVTATRHFFIFYGEKKA